MADRKCSRLALLAGFAALVLVLAGCTTPAADRFDERGPITLVGGIDTSQGRVTASLVDRWNADRGDAERVTFVEMPAATDEFRAQLRARAQDLEFGDRSALQQQCYDVMGMDMLWTAEFARAGYLVPLDPRDFLLAGFLQRPVDTATLDGRLWAIPQRTDAGLLFYRKDLLGEINAKPPKTWAELTAQAEEVHAKHPELAGYVGQLAQYEGLTVNAMEALWASGGDLPIRDGRIVAKPAELQAAMELLGQGVREGWIPRNALEFNEDASLELFQQGSALFLRNWPYAYQRLADSPLSDRFGVTRLPGPSALGGWNLGISSCSTHRKTARDFIKFLTSEPIQRELVQKAGWAPAIASLYDDPQLLQQIPDLDALRTSVQDARNRPVTPNYDEASDAIMEAFHNVLAGPMSAKAASERLTERLASLTPRR